MSDDKSSRKLDEFEAEHMLQGAALLRDKFVAKRMRMFTLIPVVLFGLGLLTGLVGMAVKGVSSPFAGVAGFSALMTLLMGFFWATGSVVRTVLTRDELQVNAGLANRKIPLGAITSCAVKQQRNRIRVGYRYEDGAWTTAMLVKLGDYVEVMWKDGDKLRRLQFTPTDPVRVAEAIQRARAGAGGARIEASAEAPLEDEALEADEDEREAQRRDA